MASDFKAHPLYAYLTRRQWLKVTIATIAGLATDAPADPQTTGTVAAELLSKLPFSLGVFSDEISQDFDTACRIAAEDLKVPFVELRGLWDKNITELDPQRLREALRILKKYRLRVSAIAGPLFKSDWPGAPRSPHSPNKSQEAGDITLQSQHRVLKREIELADYFDTPRIRCFDFYRLEEIGKYRAAIDSELAAAASLAARNGLTLVMENEPACNTSTQAEILRTLSAVPEPAFKLNWDPGNSAFAGETAFPDVYKSIPQGRIGHVHCKDAEAVGPAKYRWTAMGQGVIDYAGQFRALIQNKYSGVVVLETHWRGPHTKEEATRQSFRGMHDLLVSALA